MELILLSSRLYLLDSGKFQEDYANNSFVNESRAVKGKLENEAHWLNM